MGARQKLNQAFFLGSTFMAVLLGVVAQSWLVFGATLVILVGCNIYAGEIRGKRRR